MISMNVFYFLMDTHDNFDKTIRLKDYLTDKLVENINTATIKDSGTNTITFTNTIALKSGVRYYIDMDESTFLDYSDNPFAGIIGKDIWNFTVSVTAVKSLEDQQAELNIYPNPASGMVMMENLPDQAKQSMVEILDVTGRKVDGFQLSSHQTNYEYSSTGLKSGIYFIRVSTPAGNIIRKLVKN